MNDSSHSTCPSCGRSLPVTAEHIGRRVRCACGTVIAIPANSQSLPDDEPGTEGQLGQNTELTEIREQFERIAETYLEYSTEAERTPIPLLKDQGLIRLLQPLFAESHEADIRPQQWVKPRLQAFLKRLDLALSKLASVQRAEQAQAWLQELEAARDVLHAEWEAERKQRLGRFRRRELLLTIGILLGVCLLGAAAGLARAGVFPWPVAVVIVAAYVAGYVFLSLAR